MSELPSFLPSAGHVPRVSSPLMFKGSVEPHWGMQLGPSASWVLALWCMYLRLIRVHRWWYQVIGSMHRLSNMSDDSIHAEILRDNVADAQPTPFM